MILSGDSKLMRALAELYGRYVGKLRDLDRLNAVYAILASDDKRPDAAATRMVASLHPKGVA
jgi:hypothetical protein